MVGGIHRKSQKESAGDRELDRKHLILRQNFLVAFAQQ
jgi:hypothetical protein